MIIARLHRLPLALFALALLGLMQPVSPAKADARLALQVATACKAELQSFCSGVTAGGGRKLACLYAYGDKLNLPCERALYDASIELERALAAVRAAAQACSGDIGRYCGKVVPGQGRVALCLAAHRPSLSPGCTATLAAFSQ